jgi:hypothetical protein
VERHNPFAGQSLVVMVNNAIAQARDGGRCIKAPQD